MGHLARYGEGRDRPGPQRSKVPLPATCLTRQNAFLRPRHRRISAATGGPPFFSCPNFSSRCGFRVTQNGRKTLQGTGTEPAGLYPHGLVQPSGGLRFGLDALLLGGLYGTAAAGLAGAAGYLCRGAGLRLRGGSAGRGPGLSARAGAGAGARSGPDRSGDGKHRPLGLSARLAVRCLDVGDAVALRGLPALTVCRILPIGPALAAGPSAAGPTQCWPIRPTIGPDGLRRIPCGNGPCALPTGRRWKPFAGPLGCFCGTRGIFFAVMTRAPWGDCVGPCILRAWACGWRCPCGRIPQTRPCWCWRPRKKGRRTICTWKPR